MHVWDYKDTITLVLVVTLPILAGGAGLWFAGYTVLKQTAKRRGMTYAEYVKSLDKK